MKTNLAQIQSDLKDAVLSARTSAAKHIAKPARGTKSKAIGIYQNAYVIRLTDILAHDHELLHAYLGDTKFSNLAKNYIAAHPSENPNARWFSNHLPEFLKTYSTFKRHTEIYELASLENSLNQAFDAPDLPVMTLADLAKISPELFPSMQLSVHPSLVTVVFENNTTSIWSALKCGTKPPKPHKLESQQVIAVWRQGTASRFRLLGNEEAMAIDAAKKGANFSQICQMIAIMDGEETAAIRAATYLRGWIEAEILLAFPANPLK